MTNDELSEACRQIIQSNKFVDAKCNDLDTWTAGIVRQFIETANLRWQVASESVGPVRIIKIFDERLKYVISMPFRSYDEQTCSQFYWMIGDDPNDDAHGISPDTASAYLLSKIHPGIKVEDIRGEDGSCLTRMTLPTGEHIDITFPPGFFSNKTWANE